MDKIPNMDNTLKIVSLLEKDIFREYSLRQISQLTRLDYKTISKTIQQLLSMRIVTTKTKGKGHFISLNLNHYDLQTYLSFAAYYNRLIFFQKNASLQYLLEELKRMDLRDSCLVLFGSFVLGQQTKSSDIDLLLIT
ncbi:MAG: nucleotidyltransferase domain-containing protein, partial [Nanoarchaeota archaeon]|nr:nucleotidyltransferase domain-containing protein [Nanoarchaeota archaeon]